MSELIVRDMEPEDEVFVSTCSHVDESAEQDACGGRRAALFRALRPRGLRIKVSLLEGEHVGFAYAIPIEQASWGAVGEGLMSIPCLYVLDRATGRGAARRMVEAIETDARNLDFEGLTVTAYRDLHGADWFMPAAFFEHAGFRTVDERSPEVLLWKPFTEAAAPPRFLKPNYDFVPVEGRVVVDLFWNGLCQTSNIEAQRVREVCAEFGDAVLLQEHCAEDRTEFLRFQIPRAIFVNGSEIGWGYEAPREGVREAIRRAMTA